MYDCGHLKPLETELTCFENVTKLLRANEKRYLLDCFYFGLTFSPPIYCDEIFYHTYIHKAVQVVYVHINSSKSLVIFRNLFHQNINIIWADILKECQLTASYFQFYMIDTDNL